MSATTNERSSRPIRRCYLTLLNEGALRLKHGLREVYSSLDLIPLGSHRVSVSRSRTARAFVGVLLLLGGVMAVATLYLPW